MSIWACNCPLCRVLVRPILRLLAPDQRRDHAQNPSKQQVIVEKREERETIDVKRQEETDLGKKNMLEGSKVREREQRKEAQVENIETKQQKKDTIQQIEHNMQRQATQSIVGPMQPQQPKQEEVKPVVPKEVKEKIEKLERELGELRSELKEALESISEALIDVRAAVVENVNPFLTTNGDKQMLDMLASNVDIDNIVELIKVLNEELDKFNLDALVELIDSLAESGSISEANARILKALVKTVSEMKRRGVSVDEQVRLITLLLNRQVKSKS